MRRARGQPGGTSGRSGGEPRLGPAPRAAAAALLYPAARGSAAPASRVRKGDGAADTVILSPDGRRVLTVGSDGIATLWDAATGRERGALRGHADVIMAAALP